MIFFRGIVVLIGTAIMAAQLQAASIECDESALQALASAAVAVSFGISPHMVCSDDDDGFASGVTHTHGSSASAAGAGSALPVNYAEKTKISTVLLLRSSGLHKETEQYCEAENYAKAGESLVQAIAGQCKAAEYDATNNIARMRYHFSAFQRLVGLGEDIIAKQTGDVNPALLTAMAGVYDKIKRGHPAEKLRDMARAREEKPSSAAASSASS